MSASIRTVWDKEELIEKLGSSFGIEKSIGGIKKFNEATGTFFSVSSQEKSILEKAELYQMEQYDKYKDQLDVESQEMISIIQATLDAIRYKKATFYNRAAK